MTTARKHAIGAVIATLFLSGCADTPRTTTTLPVTLPDLTTYALVRTDAGRTAPRSVSVAQAAAVLAAYDVVVIGEAHRNPGNH